MENVRNRVDVRLVTRWDGRYGAKALIAKPNFHSRTIFAEEFGGHRNAQKLKVKFDKTDIRGYECARRIEGMSV